MPKPFEASRAAETQFTRALRKVGRASGALVESYVEPDGYRIRNTPEMKKALSDYSEALGPWARRQSLRMIEQIERLNKKTTKAKIKATSKYSSEIAQRLQSDVAQGDVGEVARRLMDEQVALIKSIPIRAAERAQKLSMEAVYEGRRAAEVAEEIARSSAVSESDALRIARTEIARSNASITQARAQAVGASGYIWRTTMDGAERKSHAEMNGKFVQYSKPPELSDGTTGHAGTFPNCRCYQDPVFDED